MRILLAQENSQSLFDVVRCFVLARKKSTEFGMPGVQTSTMPRPLLQMAPKGSQTRRRPRPWVQAVCLHVTDVRPSRADIATARGVVLIGWIIKVDLSHFHFPPSRHTLIRTASKLFV